MAYGSVPRTLTVPDRGESPRDATRTSVVFPDPLGPIRPVTRKAGAVTETSRRTSRSPYAATTFSSTKPDPSSGSDTGRPPLPPQQVQEEGPSEDGGHGSHRNLLGPDGGSRGQIGQDPGR